MDNDETYEPTETQLQWMEMLTGTVREAMRYSDDLVGAVAELQQASLVAVDVVRGDATDADLREACEASLRSIDGHVNVHPMRTALRKVMVAIDQQMEGDAQQLDPLARVSEAENAMDEAKAPRSKERAG